MGMIMMLCLASDATGVRVLGGCVDCTFFTSRIRSVNDTEPTQTGRGLFTEGRSRRESGAVFYNLYTLQKTPRVTDRTGASRASHDCSLSTRILYTVGHVCFIDRYLGFQQLTIDQTLSIRCRIQS